MLEQTNNCHLPVFDILFGSYPREFGKNRTFLKTREDAIKTINTMNRKTNCWMTIHKIDKQREYTSAIVEKLFFDLDGKNSLDKTKLFHEYLLKHDIQHVILYSGNGFHIYTMTSPASRNTGIKSIKRAVRNAQLSMIKDAKMTVGDPDECDFDSHVIGDISRISRIPNTLNLSGKRYCVPLTQHDLQSTLQDIEKKAEKQSFQYDLFGNRLIDLQEYDMEIDGLIESVDNIHISDTELSRILNDKSEIDCKKILDKLPPMINQLLVSGACGYRDRYLTILAFREIGVPIEITISICRRFWSTTKFNHAIVSEGNQFQYIYNRFNLLFPNWNTLLSEGYSISEIDRKYNFYK